MTILEKIQTALATTGYNFAHFGWSTDPDGDFGVWAEEAEATFYTESQNAESLLTGYIDLFVRDGSDSARITVDNALRLAGINFNLESIQYEPETGYVHYEWRWRDGG